MSEPTQSERTLPPRAPIAETGSVAGEHTAGLPAAPFPPTGEDFSFLEKPQADDELGRLGAFRVLKELGRGGMGCVLLAEDTGLQRPVALKVMLPSFAQDEKAKARFLREARAAGRLQHDNVVSIFQVGESNGVPFIAMEFLKGMPLDNYLKDKGGLALPIVLKIGREIGLGLAAAHNLGMIHRDIKPANVWLETLPAAPGKKTGGFRVKILDFGLARREEDGEAHLTQSGAIVGTPAYMAPEQASGEKLDARADLFSLGVLLYRLATGLPAFNGPTTTAMLLQVMSHEPGLASEVKADVPLEMARIIAKLMAKNREERYATAAEFLADWEKLAKAPKQETQTSVRSSERQARGKPHATQSIGPPANTQPAPALGPQARTMRWLVVACVLCVVLAVAAWFLIPPGETPDRLAKGKEHPPAAAHQFTLVSRFESVHRTPVVGIGVSADGRRALSVAAFNVPDSFVVWELNATGGKAVHRETFKAASYSSAISPAGDCAVVGGKSTVDFWDLKTMKLHASHREHGDMVWGMAISPDGKQAITGAHNDNFLCVWELPGGKLIKKLPLDFGSVLSIAVIPDGKGAVLGSYGGQSFLWDLDKGKLVRRFRVFQRGVGGITKMALSKDGRKLLIVFPIDGEYAIELWDVQTGNKLQEFKGHSYDLGGVRFLPDGEHFLSGAQDGTLRIWSLSTGKEIARFTDPKLIVNRLEILPDGRHFLTGGGMKEEAGKQRYDAGDHDLRLWQLPKGFWPTPEKASRIANVP